LLDFLEEALDNMALFIVPVVALPGVNCIGFGWDTVGGALAFDMSPDVVGAISLVRKNHTAADVNRRQHIHSSSTVGDVPAGKQEFYRIPQTINQRVNLCVFAAA